MAQWEKLIIGIAVTTFAWVGVTLVTRPTDDETLFRFCRLVRAGGPGWKAVEKRAEAMGRPIEGSNAKWEVPAGLLCMVFACLAVYASLFAIGSWIYSYFWQAAWMTVVAVVATGLLFVVLWRLYSMDGSRAEIIRLALPDSETDPVKTELSATFEQQEK